MCLQAGYDAAEHWIEQHGEQGDLQQDDQLEGVGGLHSAAALLGKVTV